MKNTWHILTYIAVSLLLASCFSGDKKSTCYDKALSLLGKDDKAAADAFLMAIAAKDHEADAHFQYAELCGALPENAPLAAWHYRQYLKLKPDSGERLLIQKKIDKLETAYSIVLNKRFGEGTMDETKLRLKLLEEHAMRQKLWIEELSDENRRLRANLAELQQKDK